MNRPEKEVELPWQVVVVMVLLVLTAIVGWILIGTLFILVGSLIAIGLNLPDSVGTILGVAGLSAYVYFVVWH